VDLLWTYCGPTVYSVQESACVNMIEVGKREVSCITVASPSFDGKSKIHTPHL
jgi:hypothetical protein